MFGISVRAPGDDSQAVANPEVTQDWPPELTQHQRASLVVCAPTKE
jgi:hypothetical protein